MLHVLFQPAKLHNIYYNVEAFPNYFLFPIIFHIFLGGYLITICDDIKGKAT